MNQGKLEVVKQEMARVNVDTLGISELKRTGMGEFNSDDHYIYYCGQESLRRNGVAIMVNKRVQNALIHGPNISGSYAILLFTASDLASITSHIHNWVLFLLWLHPFILSGVPSPLISSSILGTYRPEEFLFQYPIILPFHTVHGVYETQIKQIRRLSVYDFYPWWRQ